MVDASSVDVAAEFPGRLDSLLVKQGDTVKTGQLLAVLRSNEINAIKAQALSAIDAAKDSRNSLRKAQDQNLLKPLLSSIKSVRSSISCSVQLMTAWNGCIMKT